MQMKWLRLLCQKEVWLHHIKKKGLGIPSNEVRRRRSAYE